MRRAAKIDDNQTEIVNALRKVGACVFSTAGQAKGFPDLVVGFKGVNYLLEVKDSNKPSSAQALTPDQVKFHAMWVGQIAVVNSVEQALKAIGL
jgi:Holliday junction resolvase